MIDEPKYIRAIAMDGFKTTILPREHFQNPYKALISAVFSREQRGDAATELRKAILTKPIPLEYVVAEAAAMDIFVENGRDIEDELYYAQCLMDRQLREHSFKRNPEVDDVMSIADNNNLSVGIISDLAAPYGVIINNKMGDIDPRFHVYSYRTGFVKEQEEPFVIMAERMGVKLEELAYIGNDFKSDYITPKNMGMQAFWYVPNKEELIKHDVNAKKLLDMYAEDVVTTLPQVFDKLQGRDFKLGYNLGG